MPYEGERSSTLTHVDFVRSPHVARFIESCSYKQDVEGNIGDIRSKMIDVTPNVRPLPDNAIILASDASSYESVIEENYPSVRLGFLKFAHVFLPVEGYRRLRRDGERFLDPVAIAAIQRNQQTMQVPLPGAGLGQREGESSRSFFRRAIFERFVGEENKVYGHTLYDTFKDLLRRMRRISVDAEGKEWVLLGGGSGPHRSSAKNPHDDSEIKDTIRIPLEPGYVASPSDGKTPIYVTDILRIHEPFSDEGSNLEAYNRLMSALEHFLLAHIVRCAMEADPTILDNLFVVADGPLALFGEPADFHRGIMDLVEETVLGRQAAGQPGPLFIGLSKTGTIVDHAKRIERLLDLEADGETRRHGTLVIPVCDQYRKKYVNPNGVDMATNFGDGTYYGQDFIVRTSKGKVFAACVAYPFRNKRQVDAGGAKIDFRDLKVDVERYGDRLYRAVSMIEMLQTDMHENAVAPIHLAHKYASIAQSSSGRSLDAFVKSLVKARA